MGERTFTLTVRSMSWESEGVLGLDLVDPDGGQLPAWEPGAHIDVRVGGHTRQYSLCGDPGDRTCYRIAVLREEKSRGGSAWVHNELRPGQPVAVSEPRNHFRLAEHSRYLFIAGGIGITPLLPMIAAVEARGSAWRLVYGGRNRHSMAFTKRLARYGVRVALWPEDELGLIDLETALNQQDGTAVYCCGPEALLAAVERQCATQPQLTLRTERFTPKPEPEPDDGMRARDAAFEITLARSGRTLTVPPDISIVSAMEAAGLSPVYSCLEGTCGTCETAVLEGVPDHHDSILDEEDRTSGTTMMICVSRARSPRLVLDL